VSPDRPDQAPSDPVPGDPDDTGADAGGAAPDHHDDGLDLARALTRAAARSTPVQRKKSRKRDLRPTRGRVSGAHPDERDPQLLDTTVGRLVDDHGWAVDLRVHGVFGRWAELVGAEVAQHCTPESFAEGKLLVRTDSTAWATQLRLLAPTVVRRLNEELGHGTVTLIEVAGPHLPSWKKGPRSVRDGRGPRDTYG
jgi:predicted nucleic acid-binding Zn ribbon protein